MMPAIMVHGLLQMLSIRNRHPALLFVALVGLTLTSSGCVYRMTVQQGNFLDPTQVAQLQVGMTRSQVRFLLGTPMLPDAFDKDRWDYLYYLQEGRRRQTQQRRLTVYFAGDKVERFENAGIARDKPAS